MKNFLLLLCLTIFSLSSFGASNRVLDADQIDGQKQNRNYLKTFDAEKNVKGWVCTGGGSQSVTRTATTPLSGLGSFIFTLPTVGDLCYFPFTIDNGDIATVLRTTFKYLPITTVGTYADGEFEIDILDGSGVAIESKIQPSQIFGNSLPTNQPYGEWQTQAANLNYRFVIKRVVASSTSTLKVDSLFTGQATKISGPITTDWKTCTPSIALTGGVTTVIASCRREGSNLQVRSRFYFGTIFTGGTATITLPSSGNFSGLSINGIGLVASKSFVSDSDSLIVSAGTVFTGSVVYVSTNNVLVVSHGVSGTANATLGITTSVPATWINNDYIEVKFSVPISGWSSNQVLSEDVGTREIVVKATKSGDQTIVGSAATAVVTGWTIVRDTTASFNATTGIFTSPEDGTYDFSQTVYYLNGATAPGYVDIIGLAAGTSSGEYYTDVQAANKGYMFTIASSYPLKKGETYNLQAYASTNSMTIKASGTNIFIAKRSSPQQISASAKVEVEYTGNAGTVITSDTTNIDFITKVRDTHNAWSGTVFTAPKSSCYDIKGNENWAAAASHIPRLFKSTSLNKSMTISPPTASFAGFSSSICLNRGETFSIREAIGGTLSNSATDHWISIKSN